MEEINNLRDPQSTLVIPTDREGENKARQALLVQFPRRVFLLLLAFGGALLLIWGAFFMARGVDIFGPPPEWPGQLLRSTGTTLLLFFTSLLLALLLALLLTAIALFQRRIQEEVGRTGLLLRFGSRLLMFALLTPPVVLLGLIFRWLLLANIHATAPGPLSPAMLQGARFPLAALMLAGLPALLAAQAATRRYALSKPIPARGAAFLSLVAGLLATLLRQTGGILSTVAILEMVFNRPGLGDMLLLSFFHDTPDRLPSILSMLALLVLAGLLLAELCEWVSQLLAASRKPERSEVRRPRERRLWLGVAMWLLLIPLGLAGGGLITEPQLALRQDLEQRDAPPSPDHPLGTDELGRDMGTRALRAGLSTVRRSSGIAALSLIPGIFLGVLSGALAGRAEWQRESLADLLLLPLDVLLFIPLIPGTMAALLLWQMPGGPALIIVPSLLLLPRVAHATRTLWARRATNRAAGWDVLVGMSALFLGTLFISFGALIALEYVGLGPQPPLPSLGALLQEGQRIFSTNPQQLASIAVIVAGYSLAFYAAADALLDAFNTKEAMVDLNR